jgi:uncharacterized membrane protein SirB2
MAQKLNRFIDTLSEFFAARKGLLIMIGMILVVINGLLQFFPQAGWLATSNLFLHIGILVALIGVLLAWAL